MQTQITKNYPEKSLTHILPKSSGRNNTGHVTVRTQSGRHKRYYREIDWKRDLYNFEGKVVAIEYDPNRNLNIALIFYKNGEKDTSYCLKVSKSATQSFQEKV